MSDWAKPKYGPGPAFINLGGDVYEVRIIGVTLWQDEEPMYEGQFMNGRRMIAKEESRIRSTRTAAERDGRES